MLAKLPPDRFTFRSQPGRLRPDNPEPGLFQRVGRLYSNGTEYVIHLRAKDLPPAPGSM